ncbi:uncharacterized protein METZ01_LOCUS24488, partial [marine metagenome]
VFDPAEMKSCNRVISFRAKQKNFHILNTNSI